MLNLEDIARFVFRYQYTFVLFKTQYLPSLLVC